MLRDLFLFDNENIVTIVLKCTTFHVITYTKDFKLRLYGFYQDVYGNMHPLSSKKKKKERKYSIY